MRIALAQVNSTVGDLEANAALVIERMRAAQAAGADIVAFPELVISGYPPEDLLLKDHFLAGAGARCCRWPLPIPRICALVGVPLAHGTAVYNSAAIVAGGRIAGAYRKICLPNYAVFDEKRYFTPGDRTGILDLGGTHIGINICEDIWEPCGPTVVAAREGDATSCHQPLHVSLPRGQGQTNARPCWRSGRATPERTFVTSTGWAGRTSWFSTGRVWSSGPAAS